jgi:hypothetical protein
MTHSDDHHVLPYWPPEGFADRLTRRPSPVPEA